MRIITRINYLILIFFFLAITFFSGCKKGDSNTSNNNPLPPPDLTTKVNSKSVSGFITDENNSPVWKATVQVGTETVQTDPYGYFKFQDVLVTKNAALITVTKDGYFKAVKTYIANPGKSAFFRIKLIRKTIAGNLNAGSGGTVTTANGMSITLPAGSVVSSSSNVPYSGTVNIAAQWLSPARDDLADIMPGDLRGLNTDGNLQLLTTFGMAAVELTGSGGEALQITTGKKAIISFPLPTAFVSAAPAMIPLWYFDETSGLWKEEGNATKSGSSYIGEVAHFSFWNCDVPNSYVQFDCSLVTPSGNPIQHAFVKIVVVNSMGQGYGYTDSAGYVGGAVPDNAMLQLQVFSNTGSTTPCYSQNFTTGNTDISLGNITVSTGVAYVTGIVTDCNDVPVIDGCVYVQYRNSLYKYSLDNSGSYNFTQFLCGSSNTSYTITGIDYTTLLQSNPINHTLINGPQTNTNIKVCDILTEEYHKFKVDGISYVLTKPPDNIEQHVVGVPLRYYIEANASNGFHQSVLAFEGANMAVGSQQELVQFRFQNSMKSPVNNPVTVNITEYGAIGEYVSGNFSGILQDWYTNDLYEVSCSFRIKRIF